MKSRMACAAVLTALAWAPMSWAVGLGEVDLRSALNQPLDARIELVSPTEQELEALRIALASPDHFERYGLERTALHARLRFRVVDDDGRPYIHVSTQDPVREPYVSFLVEARWASGRLLREYTLLLDPPTFGPGEADQDRQPERAVTERSADEREAPRREAEQPEPAGEDRQAARESEPRAEQPDRRRRQVEDAPRPGGRYGPVRRNETLWNIADRMRPSGVSINQMMVALFEANPGAFGDNINHLRQGAVLRVPERGEIDAVSVARANREVSRQNEAWQGGRTRTAEAPEREEQDELRLVAPGDEEADSVGVGTDESDERIAELESELDQLQTAQQETAEENESLEARVSELQEELEEQRRLVELKDEQLASLQQRVSDEDLEAGLDEDVVFADETEEGETPGESEEVAEDEELAAADDDEADRADADEETRVAEVEENGGEQEQDEAATDEEPETTDPEAAEAETEEGAAPAGDGGPPAESPSIVDRATRLLSSPVGMGVLGALVLALGLGLIAMRRRKAAAEAGADDLGATLESEAADAAEAEDFGAYEDVNLAGDAGEEWDERDRGGEPDIGQSVEEVIEEADFHIAYGTYDKAASQLEEALAPNSRDPRLHLKLLEAHFAAGNADDFVSAARRMQDTVGEEAEEWSSAARMGREIAPNEGIFAAAAGVAAGGGAADEGRGEADLTPPESPAIESGQPAAGDDEPFDLDLDTGEGSGEDTGEEISFDLPDESGTDEAGAGEEGDDSLSFDLPDLEEESGESERSEAGGAEETTEDSFDRGDSDEDTIDFGLDEESASTLDRTAEEDSSEDADDSDFPTVDVPPEKANEAFGTDSQAQFEKAFQELSSYIGSDEDEEGERSEDKSGGGDRPGRTTDDDASPGGIDFGEDDDDDLLDLGDDEGDEVGEIDTKVDLARAYIDMGDADGARGILEEVIEEGNEDQKKEARSLLDSI